MAIFQGLNNQNDQQNQTQQKSRVKSVLRYTMMPEILPRIRALGFHFGHFAYLLALVFGSARLIPQTHPVMNPANIGRYGVRQVIAMAANNIKWRRENIDQIAIFSAIVIGLIMIVIQAILIAIAALIGFNPAQAGGGGGVDVGSFFTPIGNYDAADDPVMIMFAQVFGNLNGFWGADFANLTDNSENVFGTRTGIHEGVYQMLSIYSMVMMVIAVIIVLYYITTVVGEAAKTGTPFGQRFNSLWAPIRLVVALGLLVPLGSGLNSAQYITLWLAKQGAGLGTHVWGVMADSMTRPNADNYVIGDFQNDWVREAAFNIFFLETCMYASNKENYADPNSPDGIIRRVIEDDDSSTDRTFRVAYDRGAEWGDGRYRSCGEITISITEQDINSTIIGTEALPVEAAYELAVNIVTDLMGPLDSNDTGGRAIPETAMGMAREEISIDGRIPFSELYYNNVNMAADAVLNARLSEFSADDFRADVNDIIQQLFDERTNSFIYAGVWYLEISRIVQHSKDIINNTVPNFSVGTVNLRTEANVERVGGVIWSPYLVRVGSETETLISNIYNHMSNNVHAYFEPPEEAPEQCRNLGEAPSWWDSQACAIASMIIPDELVILAQDNPATRTLDPMSTLVNAGYSIFQKAWWWIGAGIVADVGGAIAAGLGFLPLTLLGSVLDVIGSIAVIIGALGLTAGFVLYFLLPVLPFIYFFFAVITWVMEIFEAIIAMPLWALSFLQIGGEGMPGQAAMNGFYLLLSILIRPALIVIALVAGALIFGAGVFMLQSLFDSVLLIKGSGNSSGLELIIYSLIFAYCCYMIGTTSFKLVDTIPNQIMRWIGSNPGTFSDGREDPISGNQQMLGAAGAFIGGSMANSISSGAKGAGQATGREVKDRFGLQNATERAAETDKMKKGVMGARLQGATRDDVQATYGERGASFYDRLNTDPEQPRGPRGSGGGNNNNNP